jgi:hypothetical protein
MKLWNEVRNKKLRYVKRVRKGRQKYGKTRLTKLKEKRQYETKHYGKEI